MKCVEEQTIEKIIERKLRLEDLKIDGKEFSLDIENEGGILSLNFNKDKHPTIYSVSEYRIVIDEKGIRFERFVRRPNHDHNDLQRLQVVVDPVKAYGKGYGEGDLCWRSAFPYQGSGYAFFYIPFGGIKIND